MPRMPHRCREKAANVAKKTIKKRLVGHKPAKYPIGMRYIHRDGIGKVLPFSQDLPKGQQFLQARSILEALWPKDYSKERAKFEFITLPSWKISWARSQSLRLQYLATYFWTLFGLLLFLTPNSPRLFFSVLFYSSASSPTVYSNKRSRIVTGCSR